MLLGKVSIKQNNFLQTNLISANYGVFFNTPKKQIFGPLQKFFFTRSNPPPKSIILPGLIRVNSSCFYMRRSSYLVSRWPRKICRHFSRHFCRCIYIFGRYPIPSSNLVPASMRKLTLNLLPTSKLIAILKLVATPKMVPGVPQKSLPVFRFFQEKQRLLFSETLSFKWKIIVFLMICSKKITENVQSKPLRLCLAVFW